MRSKSCATTRKRGKCRCGNGHSSSENIRTARCPITKRSKSERKRSGQQKRRCLERRKNLLKKRRKRQSQRPPRRKPNKCLGQLPTNKMICSAPIKSGLTILPILLRLASGCLIRGVFSRALLALGFDWGDMFVCLIIVSVFWAWAINEHKNDPIRCVIGVVLGGFFFLPTIFINEVYWTALFVLFWAGVLYLMWKRNSEAASRHVDWEEELEAERRRRKGGGR